MFFFFHVYKTDKANEVCNFLVSCMVFPFYQVKFDDLLSCLPLHCNVCAHQAEYICRNMFVFLQWQGVLEHPTQAEETFYTCDKHVSE